MCVDNEIPIWKKETLSLGELSILKRKKDVGKHGLALRGQPGQQYCRRQRIGDAVLL